MLMDPLAGQRASVSPFGLAKRVGSSCAPGPGIAPFESRLHGEDVGCPETGIVSVEQKASHSLRLPAEMTRLER